MQRYIRAFVTALRLTLRGEVLQSPLQAWIDEALQLVGQVHRATQQAEINPASLRLPIDRRETSMQVIIATLEHHLQVEYPRLLQTSGGANMLYPSNLDDHFRLSRLAEAVPAGSPLQAAINTLMEHLEAVPQQQD